MLVGIYVVVVVLLGRYLLRVPHALLRPSVWFSVCMMLLINAGAAWASIEGDAQMDYPVAFRVLSITFPLGVLFWVFLSPHLTAVAGDVLARCRSSDLPKWRLSQSEKYFVTLLGALVSIVLVCYCREVSIDRLGLSAILSQRSDAAMSREESLKLLSSDWLRYGYTLHMCVFGPLLACVATLWFPRKSRWLVLPVLLVLTLSVMLSGARSAAGFLLVSLAIAHLVRKGLRRGCAAVGLSALVAMLMATLLSIYREASADSLSMDTVMSAMTGGIAERVFVVPFEMGISTMRYAQDHGLLGIHNIRPLTVLFDCDFVSLPNEVFREFYARKFVMAVDSGYANCCFLFDFQASFGLPGGWLVSLAVLAPLDLSLLWFRRLPPGLLIACLATFLLGTFSLISGAYTTCLISNGLVPTLALVGAYVQFFSRLSAGRDAAGTRRWQAQLRAAQKVTS